MASTFKLWQTMETKNQKSPITWPSREGVPARRFGMILSSQRLVVFCFPNEICLILESTLAKTSLKKTLTQWPKMMGSDTFIIVAFMCSDIISPWETESNQSINHSTWLGVMGSLGGPLRYR
jgi:hypothetical protein